jgi:hypothetical protein
MHVRLVNLTTPLATTATTTNMGDSITGNIIHMYKYNKGCHHRKQKYTVSDLPFPHGGRYTQTWHKVFVPNLLAWAGSQDDLFGTNGQVHLEATKIWNHVFTDVPLKDADKDILIYVVCSYPSMSFKLINIL